MHSAPSTLMSGWIQEERTVGKDWKGPLPELCATWRPRRPSSVRAAQKEGIPTTTGLSKAPGLSRAAAEGGGVAGLLRPRREELVGRWRRRAVVQGPRAQDERQTGGPASEARSDSAKCRHRPRALGHRRAKGLRSADRPA